MAERVKTRRTHRSSSNARHVISRTPTGILEAPITAVADTGAPRPPGLYMLPIVYENHCASCHPLQFEEKRDTPFARHGITPEETLNDLRQLYMSEATKDHPGAARAVRSAAADARPAFTADRARSSVRPLTNKVIDAARLLFGAAVDDDVRRKEKLPLGRRGCVECHNLKPGAGPIVDSSSLASIGILDVVMTPVWQKHAMFNHRNHRALSCLECHAQASVSKENGGDQPSLLPKIDTCVRCHAPAKSESGSGPGGGASTTVLSAIAIIMAIIRSRALVLSRGAASPIWRSISSCGAL